MTGGAEIKGFEEVMKNLNAEIAKIKGVTMNGLIQSSILIRRDMEFTPPLIPIDLGNLRASWFTTTMKSSQGPGIVIGFSANYAVYLHEDLTRKNFKRPNSGPKFLQAAIERNTKQILQILNETAKI